MPLAGFTTMQSELSFVWVVVAGTIGSILGALPLFLQVPSFSIGQQGWILHWQNDETGSGIQFNLLFLLSIAVILGLLVTFAKPPKKRRSQSIQK